jgi:hypothetical protein
VRALRIQALGLLAARQRVLGRCAWAVLAEICRPGRLALVVYDMQVGIVPQLPGGGGVSAIARRR